MKIVLRRRWVGVIGGVLLVLCFAAEGASQSTDRAGIEGRVVDESGAALPGVTVTIASPSLIGSPVSNVSDGEGRYRFTGLPAGTYTVAAQLQGFRAINREGIRLTTAFVATVDLQLQIGGLEETLTVSGASPVVDIRTTAVDGTFTREELESLPTARQVWQIMDLAPGLRVTGGFTGNTPDVGGNTAGLQQLYVSYGSSKGGNRPTLEGVDTHEQTERSPFYFDFGAFEELQVKAMANDAEVPVSGLNMVAVVKSGGNTFRGGALFQWQNPDMQSSNIDDAQRARGATQGNRLTEYIDFNADLGGRIIRDRLWFYGAHRQQHVGSEVVGFSQEPGPDGRYGTADDIAGDAKTDMTIWTAKLSAQITPKQKLVGFFTNSTKLNPYSGGGTFVPGEATALTDFGNNVAKAEWNYVLNNQSIINAFVGRNWWENAYTLYTDKPATFDTVTQQWRGMAQVTGSRIPAPYGPARQRTQFNTSYTQFVPNALGGSHELKAGWEMVVENYQTAVDARPNGQDMLHRLQNGQPFEVVLYNSPFRSRADMTTQSFFLKDSWRLGQRLTLNIGLRADYYDAYLPEQSKPEGRFSAAQTLPQLDVMTWFSVVPRVAASYALTSDSKTVLKASYGRFGFLLSPDYGRPFNTNDLIQSTYRWSDLNGNGQYEPGEEGAFVSRTGATNRVLDRDLMQPRVDEVTFTFERELMANLGARASYIYKREGNLYQAVNTARPASAYNIPITVIDPGPDGVSGTSDDGGRLTYYDFDPAYRGAAFERIIDINTPNYNDSFHNIELAATKRLSNKWHFMATYLATKKDVWRLGIPQDPNAEFFPKDQTWEWMVKLAGGYLLPYGIQTSGTLTHQSGIPWARDARFTTGLQQLTQVILLMEPIGARRRPHVNLATLRLEKRFALPRNNNFAVQFDVFNALNTNVETGSNQRSGSTFNNITAVVPPRVARFGVTYTF